MRLSILDQSPVLSGLGARAAIEATLALARRADEIGYHRYWLAEHHAIAALADPCPEVLLARLGAETKRMRVGTGGVLLPYYSAFRVAESFRMLEALYPGRVDLGIGRAPGGDARTAQAVSGGGFPDAARFPALRLARDALRQGGAAPTVLRNDAREGNRRVVALRGSRSNRFGVGAVVRTGRAAGTTNWVVGDVVAEVASLYTFDDIATGSHC